MTSREIPLTSGMVAIVDAEDFERLSGFSWFASKHHRTWYARRSVKNIGGKRSTISMHREVMHAPKGLQVDHVNHNGLDNRKANLRLATCAQNMCNRQKQGGSSRSVYKGITHDKRNGKWHAQISIQNKNTYLGTAPTEEEAAKLYDAAAKKYFGPFAKVNFP